MAFTRIELIDLVLEQAGLDYTYRPDARKWLNLILASLTMDYDWPQNRVVQADTAFTGATAYTLPTDFSSADTCFLVQNGATTPIFILENYEFDLRRSLSLSGDPRLCYIDEANLNIVFESSPAQGNKYFRLSYYKVRPDLALDESDDGTTPWFPGQEYLYHALLAKAWEHRDDSRYREKVNEAEADLRQCLLNVYNTNSTSKIQLNAEVHRPGRRGTRGWGFFGA